MLSIVGSACGGDRRAKEKSERDEAAEAAEHGKEKGEGVEFCGEHGVPEAMCTKCNPDLIAGFKKKGDWCDEHGFPESVCPICNPVPGAPKVVVVESDGAPADKTRLCLKSPEAASLAGVATAPAVSRAEGSSLVVPATIAFDATRRAVVNARAPGVVRALHVDIGARVEKGKKLAVVDSATVGADRAQLQGARARVRAAEANYRRDKELQTKGVSSAKEVLALEQELELARAEVGSLSASIGVVGMNAGGAGGYAVTAPLAGWIVERDATIGEMVDADETLFEVVDTSTMWAELSVPEDQVDQVALGQAVIVTVDGLKGRQFEGTISYVSPKVDPRTRTIQVRAALANPEGRLRANMYGEARVVLGDRGEAVTVPADAVQRVKDVYFVYVQTKDDEFEIRRVDLGARERAVTELTSGVSANERVVVSGAFALKAETLKDSMGDGCVDD
ncbi:MAG: efflux RND transporter periplasmic adaptor subunit [Myxococcales bacterium]|nr:efflux RND transporter periplasmic adaptor subunit [Myxococcales bacterium]MBK7194494.1 efflux RND transporter periplasmic adaptor subunit [Myxococcales bacterium]